MTQVHSVDESFDRLVANTDQAMVAVTARRGDERDACLVGFHGQVGIEPRRYAVWLARTNRTYSLALHAPALGVHFLRSGDDALADRLGGLTADDVDKFSGLELAEGWSGMPLLQDCPHRFVGRRIAVLDVGGDHVAFVLEPTEVHGDGTFVPLRLSATSDIEPGHPPDDPRHP